MAAFGIPHRARGRRRPRRPRRARDSRSRHASSVSRRASASRPGEVVVDETDSTFATGEAVNVAARLQQAAAPGEILIGRVRATVSPRDASKPSRLAHSSCAAFAIQLLPTARSRCDRRTAPRESVCSVRRAPSLSSTCSRTPSRARSATGVRRSSRSTGNREWGRAGSIREFLAGVEGTTILSGRALPYGEGVTYWPLAEMVKAGRGNHGRRPDGDGQAEADRVLRRRGDRRAARARVRRDGSGRGRAWRSRRSPGLRASSPTSSQTSSR